MKKIYLLLISLIVTIIIILITRKPKKLDECFYSYEEVYPFLEVLRYNKDDIKQEVMNLENENWMDWVEKNLYPEGTWKIIPFYGFGQWVEEGCKMCPTITRILQNIR